jgi:hypothetical protein
MLGLLFMPLNHEPPNPLYPICGGVVGASLGALWRRITA